MRKIITLLLFLSASIGIAQTQEEIDKIIAGQTKWYLQGLEQLKNDEPNKAYFLFGVSKEYDSISEIGKMASIKVDSLKPILRKELIAKLIGTWKLKISGTNWGMTSSDKYSTEAILIISENSFSFYRTDKTTKQNQHIRTENIQFNDLEATLPSHREVVFSNNEIWSIQLKEDNQILHLTNTGNLINNNSRSEIVCGNLEELYERIK